MSTLSGGHCRFAQYRHFFGQFQSGYLTHRLVILLVLADGGRARLTSKKRGRDNAATAVTVSASGQKTG